ncbi:hypothetical protein H257_13059 [Aphanomyces astaci]|uniref:Secreted protein n=1 Tax=Aphanomyces astaci TaxID=112090 RepID=W4FXD4_APHAT|nr:hypothetical protein H257_13059 [Aphanomyces astaci]ETV71596.1 hypothetical protein H257_13059 [Aphanomyces astaci]|eukprot:XP_009838784.1 hypothetical protein H257_13059 [Aphanomyces astaci]
MRFVLVMSMQKTAAMAFASLVTAASRQATAPGTTFHSKLYVPSPRTVHSFSVYEVPSIARSRDWLTMVLSIVAIPSGCRTAPLPLSEYTMPWLSSASARLEASPAKNCLTLDANKRHWGSHVP